MKLKELGENIRQTRLEKGFTQQKLSDEIDKSLSSIKKYESGKVVPPIEVLEKISKILDVRLEELLPIEITINKQPLYQYTTKELLEELLRRKTN